MNQLPAWTALVVLLPLAAAYELRHGRPRPWLVWLSLAAAVALVLNGLISAPADVWTGLLIVLVGVAWGTAVLAVLAALERLPRAIGALRARPRDGHRHERGRGAVRAADASRA